MPDVEQLENTEALVLAYMRCIRLPKTPEQIEDALRAVQWTSPDVVSEAIWCLLADGILGFVDKWEVVVVDEDV